MLRVTVHDDAGALTFQVEGRLAGDWVRELHDCWQRALTGRHRPVVCVDLAGVTLVDAAGKELLAELHRAGATLLASGVLTRAVVAEVTEEAATPKEAPSKEEGKGKSR
jgi:ABC-type transporter Mla MlaB component